MRSCSHGKSACCLLDIGNRCVQAQFRTRFFTFANQHVDDLLRTVITEKLAQFFFMKSDLVAGYQLHEIILRIA
jgi:hypothetical protein